MRLAAALAFFKVIPFISSDGSWGIQRDWDLLFDLHIPHGIPYGFCISHLLGYKQPYRIPYVFFFGNGCWMIRRYPNKIWMGIVVVPQKIKNEILVLDGIRLFFWTRLQTAMVWNLVPLWQFRSTTGDAPLLCLLTSRCSSCHQTWEELIQTWYQTLGNMTAKT